MGLFGNKKNIYLVTLTVVVVGEVEQVVAAAWTRITEIFTMNKVAIAKGWVEPEGRFALSDLADEEGTEEAKAEVTKLAEQGVTEAEISHLQVKCWGHAGNALTARKQSVAAVSEIDGVLSVASNIRGWVRAGQRDLETYMQKVGMSAEPADD